MTVPMWLLVGLSLTELLLLFLVVVFFWRLRQSEEVLSKLRDKQEELLNKLRFNAQLEQELVESFDQRQAELTRLDDTLAERSAELQKMLKRAEEYCRSPHFLREIILSGYRAGKSVPELARATGLSKEEVELICDEADI